MAQRVPRIPNSEKPTFDAAVYSDRLAETRAAEGALEPVQVFDKNSPSSIVPLARYVKGKLTDTVNALTAFTADLKVDLDEHAGRIGDLERRVAALEAQPATRFP
jgi:hypothetical protein